jgi:hypothetical protein
MKVYEHVQTTPWIGDIEACRATRCPAVATVVLRYYYVGNDARGHWSTRKLCDRHCEAWLNAHNRQQRLFAD